MKALRFLLFLCGTAIFAASPNPGVMPDPLLTPGATLQVTTATVCESGYSSQARKGKVTASLKSRVYDAYHIPPANRSQYVIDHLKSLEIGGANTFPNLWAERSSGPWNSHIKDKLENKLHRMVCVDKSMTMQQAQTEIATDWIAAYKKHFPVKRKSQ